jgi:hypothetical protein
MLSENSARFVPLLTVGAAQLVDLAGFPVSPSSFIGGCATEIMTSFDGVQDMSCQASFGQAPLGSKLWLQNRMIFREYWLQPYRTTAARVVSGHPHNTRPSEVSRNP